MGILKKILMYVIIGVLITMSGCNNVKEVHKGVDTEKEPPVSLQPPAEEPAKPASVDPAAIKANETGKVMILMYHVIGAEKESDWIQTSENFRRDLLTLYNEGYALIDLIDFVENNIKTPAGKTPVVITFDDASIGQFRYILKEDGTKEIDPESAVGILLDFALKHQGFGSTATFYINADPFGQREYRKEKLQELVELGFSIGNHSLTHPKLNKLGNEGVQKELAALAKLVEEAVAGYKVRSLALPFGIFPTDKSLASNGSYEGYSYSHKAVLKVGANPAVSPNNHGFDPLSLPRVQASTKELGKWLEYFRKHPEERYISDGNPLTIALPEEKAELLNKESIGDKELIIY